MLEEISNAILAYNLASSSLTTSLDRLVLIMRSGVDVHAEIYAKCLERIETVQQTLTALDTELEQHKAERRQCYTQ